MLSGGDAFLWLAFVPYYTARATAVCLWHTFVLPTRPCACAIARAVVITRQGPNLILEFGVIKTKQHKLFGLTLNFQVFQNRVFWRHVFLLTMLEVTETAPGFHPLMNTCAHTCTVHILRFFYRLRLSIYPHPPAAPGCCTSDSVFSKDALLSHIRERKCTGIPLYPCLVGRRVVPTARW